MRHPSAARVPTADPGSVASVPPKASAPQTTSPVGVADGALESSEAPRVGSGGVIASTTPGAGDAAGDATPARVLDSGEPAAAAASPAESVPPAATTPGISAAPVPVPGSVASTTPKIPAAPPVSPDSAADETPERREVLTAPPRSVASVPPKASAPQTTSPVGVADGAPESSEAPGADSGGLMAGTTPGAGDAAGDETPARVLDSGEPAAAVVEHEAATKVVEPDELAADAPEPPSPAESGAEARAGPAPTAAASPAESVPPAAPTPGISAAPVPIPGSVASTTPKIPAALPVSPDSAADETPERREVLTAPPRSVASVPPKASAPQTTSPVRVADGAPESSEAPGADSGGLMTGTTPGAGDAAGDETSARVLDSGEPAAAVVEHEAATKVVEPDGLAADADEPPPPAESGAEARAGPAPTAEASPAESVPPAAPTPGIAAAPVPVPGSVASTTPKIPAALPVSPDSAADETPERREVPTADPGFVASVPPKASAPQTTSPVRVADGAPESSEAPGADSGGLMTGTTPGAGDAAGDETPARVLDSGEPAAAAAEHEAATKVVEPDGLAADADEPPPPAESGTEARSGPAPTAEAGPATVDETTARGRNSGESAATAEKEPPASSPAPPRPPSPETEEAVAELIARITDSGPDPIPAESARHFVRADQPIRIGPEPARKPEVSTRGAVDTSTAASTRAPETEVVATELGSPKDKSAPTERPETPEPVKGRAGSVQDPAKAGAITRKATVEAAPAVAGTVVPRAEPSKTMSAPTDEAARPPAPGTGQQDSTQSPKGATTVASEDPTRVGSPVAGAEPPKTDPMPTDEAKASETKAGAGHQASERDGAGAAMAEDPLEAGAPKSTAVPATRGAKMPSPEAGPPYPAPRDRAASGDTITIGELLEGFIEIDENDVFYVHSVTADDRQGLWGIIQQGITENFARGISIPNGDGANVYQVEVPRHADEVLEDRSSSPLGLLIYRKSRHTIFYNRELGRLTQDPDVTIYPGNELIIVGFEPEEIITLYNHFLANGGG